MNESNGLDLDFDIDIDIFDEEAESKPETEKEEKHISVTHRLGHRHLTRKASSEAALSEALDWHFRDGDCYHCFSFGDVDAMTYVKHVLRQQKIKYMALSTWCMAGEDVKDMMEWHRIGEIFKGSYPDVYDLSKKFLEECGGRLCVFRNHSKVTAIKGERFDCLIESSANVNTNPRSENTVLTVDSSLVNSYIKLFSEIVPFNKDFINPPFEEK